MDVYEGLANAVIEQAVYDYRKARNYVRSKTQLLNAGMTDEEVNELQHKINLKKAVIDECSRFFLSDWFKTLTNIDGPMLLRRLQEE